MKINAERTLIGLIIAVPVVLLGWINRPASVVRAALRGAVMGGIPAGTALATLAATSDGWKRIPPDQRREEIGAAVLVGGVVGGYFGLIATLLLKALHRQRTPADI
ncbi:MAG: hypothetical protein WD603_01045 [Patescibacteria group bacterium]